MEGQPTKPKGARSSTTYEHFIAARVVGFVIIKSQLWGGPGAASREALLQGARGLNSLLLTELRKLDAAGPVYQLVRQLLVHSTILIDSVDSTASHTDSASILAKSVVRWQQDVVPLCTNLVALSGESAADLNKLWARTYGGIECIGGG